MLGSHVQDVKLAIRLFTIGACFKNEYRHDSFVFLCVADLLRFPISVAKTKCCDPDEDRPLRD